jgi:hypothetical protein
MALMSSTIFYLSIFVYMFIKKIYKEISYFYGFCILIWSLYHYILISIIFSYIQAISDRPEEVQGKNEETGPAHRIVLYLSWAGEERLYFGAAAVHF